MWIIKRTGEIFPNRKEVKDVVGHSKFNSMLKKGEIYYITPEMLSKLYNFSVLKKESLSIQSIDLS